MAKGIHVHFGGGGFAAIVALLTELKSSIADLKVLIQTMIQKETQMAVDLTQLKAEVAGIRTVTDSAIALIKAIAAKLAELGNQPTVDPAELAQMASDLHADSADLAGAITQNTPTAQGA